MTNDEGRTAEAPVDRIEKMPEFKENPFRRRIAEVFSESGTGNMCFEDFLDMLSVFSEAAPKHIKMHYAFKIYDYDNDGKLGPKDIELATIALTKGELQLDDVKVCFGLLAATLPSIFHFEAICQPISTELPLRGIVGGE